MKKVSPITNVRIANNKQSMPKNIGVIKIASQNINKYIVDSHNNE